MTPEDYHMIKWVSSRHPHSPYKANAEVKSEPVWALALILNILFWGFVILTM